MEQATDPDQSSDSCCRHRCPIRCLSVKIILCLPETCSQLRTHRPGSKYLHTGRQRDRQWSRILQQLCEESFYEQRFISKDVKSLAVSLTLSFTVSQTSRLLNASPASVCTRSVNFRPAADRPDDNQIFGFDVWQQTWEALYRHCYQVLCKNESVENIYLWYFWPKLQLLFKLEYFSLIQTSDVCYI